MAPIFKLPVEIFAEIFRRAVEGETSHLTSVKSPVPASLSFVCRLWREIALGLPDLWASIAFDTRANMKIALPELLDLYLSRSRNAPLSIRGTLLRDCDAPSFDSILRASRRWRSLELHFDPAYIPKLNTVQFAVPLLESLSLDLSHPLDDTRWLDHDIVAFVDAPSLRSISGCDRALRHLLAPSEQITALTAYTADLRFTTILARSHRNLRHLTLRDWRCPPNFMSAPPLALRTLCLIQDVDRSALATSLSHVFTRLVLPQLHSLHIEGSAKAQGEQCLDWDVLAFAVMAQRMRITPCPLTTLRLVHVHLSAADLVTALLALPLLENLTIVEAHHGHGPGLAPISDTFLTRMTWPCLACPELRTLRLAGRLGFDDQRLVEMVRSRRGSHDGGGAGAGAGQDSGAGQLASLRSVAELRALALVARNPERLGVLKSRLVVLMMEDPAFDLEVVAEDTLGTGAPCADCQRF